MAEKIRSKKPWVVRKIVALVLSRPALVLGMPAVILVVAATLVPLLSLGGLEAEGHFLQAVISPFCHQNPSRSLMIGGQPVALCARCFSIYFSFALTLFLVTPKRAAFFPPVPLWLALLSLVPVAVDGTSQLFGSRESINSLRVATGLVMGAGLAFFVAVHVGKTVWENREGKDNAV